jgi:phosphate transport system substrate-binding protein
MKTTFTKLTLLAAGLAVAAGTALADITVKGSDTMVILGQKWAEVYMQKTPGTKVQVTGGGSGIGFAALQNKQTDLANASRKIKAKEIEQCLKAFGKRPREYAVAKDGLSVYVHADNPLKELSVEEVADIFTGKIKNWKELGGDDAAIILYSRENSSGTYEFFKEHVLQGKDFAANAQTLAGTAQVLQGVANDKRAIGYGGAAYGQGAKHLKIAKTKGGEAIEPNEETVVGDKYPISRFLYIYLNPELEKGDVKAYLDWIRSDDGQKVVKDIGYFPLPAHLRKK